MYALLFLALFALLYLALAWPGAGWDQQWPRRLCFALLGTLAVALLTLTERRAALPGDPGRALNHYWQANLAARQAYSIPLLRMGQGRAPLLRRAVQHYEAAIRHAPMAPPSPLAARYRRELAILYLAEGNRFAARQAAAAVVQGLRQRRATRADAEARLWNLALAERPPTPAQAEEIDRLAAVLDLDFFGRLLAAESYERAGLPDRAEDLRTECTRIASRSVQRSLLVLGIPVFLGLGLGIVFTAVVLVLAWYRALPRETGNWGNVAPALWEGFILYQLLLAAPMALVRWWNPLANLPPERGGIVLIGVNLAWSALALVALAYLVWRLRSLNHTPLELGLRARPVGVNLLWGIIAYPVVLVNLAWLGALTRWLGERWFPQVPQPYHPLFAAVGAADDPWVRLGLVVLAVVVAPVSEELFFRGALYGALRRQLGVWPAAILSAAYFAMLHPQLPLGFLLVAGLGVALALLYEWRRSLVPAVVLHALNNGLALLLTLAILPPE